MDDLLYNPPPFKKSRDFLLPQKEWFLGFRPQDFFFLGDDLLVFSGQDIKIFSESGDAHYTLHDFKDEEMLRLSAHSGCIVFYNYHGRQALLHQGKVSEITDKREKTEGLALISGSLYRFLRHREALRVESAALREDGGHYPFQPLHELSRGRYEGLFVEEDGVLLHRPAESPLSGSYLAFLDKNSGQLSQEIYLPERLGHTVHALFAGKLYVVRGQEIYVLDLASGKEVARIALGDFYVRRIAVQGKKILILDFNNFIRIFHKGKERIKFKMPGNFHGLALREHFFLMADRQEERVVAFHLP